LGRTCPPNEPRRAAVPTLMATLSGRDAAVTRLAPPASLPLDA